MERGEGGGGGMVGRRRRCMYRVWFLDTLLYCNDSDLFW